MRKTMTRTAKKKIVAQAAFVILAAVLIFVGVFFLYDSPAAYVRTQDGAVYVNADGAPILYYTDLFGRTFYEEDGKRIYAAVPTYMDTQPLHSVSE